MDKYTYIYLLIFRNFVDFQDGVLSLKTELCCIYVITDHVSVIVSYVCETMAISR